MDEPSRMERMVGEIIGLRMLVAELVERQGGADEIRDQVLERFENFTVRSDTPEGAERISACCANMLNNFPQPMDKQIS